MNKKLVSVICIHRK